MGYGVLFRTSIINHPMGGMDSTYIRIQNRKPACVRVWTNVKVIKTARWSFSTRWLINVGQKIVGTVLVWTARMVLKTASIAVYITSVNRVTLIVKASKNR
jgi:hypothetical protein